jgi:N-acetyl-anhydromuramyl-L-alanine amidase AmpD
MGEIFYPAHGSNYRVGRRAGIDTIVIHVTNGPEGSGGAPWAWFGMDHGTEPPTSAHISVDPGGIIYRSVPDDDTAFHAGTYNDRSLGVEIVGVNGYDFTEPQLTATAGAVAHWAQLHNIPVDRQHIIGHVEVPGATHTDPGAGFDWVDFMNRVHASSPSGTDRTTTVIVGALLAMLGALFLMR